MIRINNSKKKFSSNLYIYIYIFFFFINKAGDNVLSSHIINTYVYKAVNGENKGFFNNFLLFQKM